MTLYSTLSFLSKTLSVSGGEDAMANALCAHLAPYCEELKTDALLNLVALKKRDPEKPRLLLCAHMDEIGFLVTDIDKSGFVSLAPLGFQSPANCAYANLKFEGGARGVLVPPNGTKLADLDVTAYKADLGAKTRSAALRLVKIGERCATVSPIKRLSGSRVCGRALDNKAGVAVLLAVAERLATFEDLPFEVAYLFTSQEEVGCRGASAAAFSEAPVYAINVDVTIADDEPAGTGIKKLGGGACIKYKDASVLPSRKMIAHLEACAANEHIPTQAEILIKGGTDTSVIQSSRAGVCAGAISIPERYVHTDAECVDLNDMESCVSLLCAAARTPFKG